jgi:hypothetical protein
VEDYNIAMNTLSESQILNENSELEAKGFHVYDSPNEQYNLYCLIRNYWELYLVKFKEGNTETANQYLDKFFTQANKLHFITDPTSMDEIRPVLISFSDHVKSFTREQLEQLKLSADSAFVATDILQLSRDPIHTDPGYIFAKIATIKLLANRVHQYSTSEILNIYQDFSRKMQNPDPTLLIEVNSEAERKAYEFYKNKYLKIKEIQKTALGDNIHALCMLFEFYRDKQNHHAAISLALRYLFLTQHHDPKEKHTYDKRQEVIAYLNSNTIPEQFRPLADFAKNFSNFENRNTSIHPKENDKTLFSLFKKSNLTNEWPRFQKGLNLAYNKEIYFPQKELAQRERLQQVLSSSAPIAESKVFLEEKKEAPAVTAVNQFELSHLPDSDFDSQVVIDCMTPDHKFAQGSDTLANKWKTQRGIPCPMLFGQDLIANKVKLKNLFIDRPALTRIYLNGHCDIGSDFLTNEAGKKFSYQEIASSLVHFIKDQNVVINITACSASAGKNPDHSDSFASKLQQEILKLSDRNIDVVARASVLFVAQPKKTYALDQLTELKALNESKRSSNQDPVYPVEHRKHKQPNSKFTHRVVNGKTIRIDSYQEAKSRAVEREKLRLQLAEEKRKADQQSAIENVWKQMAKERLTDAKLHTTDILKQELLSTWLNLLSQHNIALPLLYSAMLKEFQSSQSVLFNHTNFFKRQLPKFFKAPVAIGYVSEVIERGAAVFGQNTMSVS